MKFSFLTYQFCRYPLEYSFKMANKYGFQGVEIWGARPHAYAYDINEDSIKEIREWQKKYNVTVSMFTPEILAYPYSLVSPLEKERYETVEYLKKSLDVAAGIGTDKMQVTIPHPGYGRDRKGIWLDLINNFKELTEYAEKLGVDIILEPLSPSEGGNIINTVDDVLDLFSAIESSNFKAMIDVVPPVIANEPFTEYFEKLQDKLDYIHICNSDGKTEFHMQLDDPNGVVPIQDMFSIFKSYGYKGWYSLELLAPYFKDPELYLCQAKRVIDKLCK